MENYKEEINKLQTQLDELKSKIKKPKFEVGKVYYKKSMITDLIWIFEIESFSSNVITSKWCIELNKNGTDFWNNHFSLSIEGNERLATPKEVEEALTKEAVKRYKDKTVLNLIKDRHINPHEKSKLSLDRFHYNKNVNKLYHSVDSDWSILIFDNGVWGDTIKTKTIDELAEHFINEYNKSVFVLEPFTRRYLTENKREIIETLNNL